MPQPHTSLFQKVPFCEMKTMPSHASCCWVAALRLPFSKHHCLSHFCGGWSARPSRSTPSCSRAFPSHTWGPSLSPSSSIPDSSGEGEQLTQGWTAPVLPVRCGYTAVSKPANEWAQLTAGISNHSNIPNLVWRTDQLHVFEPRALPYYLSASYRFSG